MQKFDFTVDWLEFTYRAPEECDNGFEVFEKFKADFPEIVLDWQMNADQVVILDKGRNFYDSVFAFSDVYTVCYHTVKDKMGVHVTFPGHGIWKISEIFGFNDINEHEACKKLFKILDDRNCTITRLDIAYDDYTKTFTPKDFSMWMLQERITSESRCWNYITSASRSGDTFYLGKRGRERYLRVYDKNYESNGKINAIRYEFELKQRWSRTVQEKVLNDEIFCFADLIDSMFTVKEDWGFTGKYVYDNRDIGHLEHNDAVRKNRAAVDEKWILFLETIRKTHDAEIVVALPKEKEQYSLKKLDNWINEYIAPSLFIYRAVVGSDAFNRMIDDVLMKLKPKQQAMIRKYQLEKDEYFDFDRKKLFNI